MNEEEFKNLRSQIATSSLNKHGGRRYMPYVFTEQVIAMLSAVLKSDIAVEVSIKIMNSFVEIIKEFLESNIYLNIIKKLGVDKFNKELRIIEIERLINRLKQRQFLIEGFNCKLYSEKEFVEFYKQKI
ncbi:ORF6N domain-containing protein [Streptobacillus felis]|uniref:ORF6N domain-containing protein n=1 Tax=Streptobacillus felis TaxID=1384509 RepID=UPI001C553E6E|nr:ORF6N domain-containing protein [Streptobacillus felis]